jgi:hypothetical protein
VGRNSQKRRTDKQRKQQRRRAAGAPRGATNAGGWRSEDDEAALIEQLLLLGGGTAVDAGAGEVAAMAEMVVAQARLVGATTFVPVAGSVLARHLVPVWEGGWQPGELVRHVRRQAGPAHAELVVAALAGAESWAGASGAPAPSSWTAQLAELGVGDPVRPGDDWFGRYLGAAGRPFTEVVVVMLETFGALMTLPAIEALIPRPSEWSLPVSMRAGESGDDPVLAKIRALLAKAESTGFEAESEALTAKAQELMARHAIDDALARATAPRQECPVTRRIPVDDPYISAKSLLLQVVARANGVRCVWYEDLAMMAVVGFGRDLDAVATLFTSLLVQGSRAMLAKGKVTDERGRSRTRSFRQSFLVAYADRIGERLTMAAVAARRQAEAEMSTSLVPVLADRDREVDEAVARAFPHLKVTRGPAITNEAGWRAGRTAAELATLGTEQGMVVAG